MADLQVYATDDDLSNWVDTETLDDPRLLRYASIRVARACNLNPYQVPDPSMTDALRDATCVQVASWMALGVDPAKGGTDMPGPVKRSSIAQASVERDTTSASKLLEQAADGLCDEACEILLQAGLLYVPVPLGADSTDQLPDWGQGRTWFTPWTDPLSGEVQFLGWWS